MRPIRVGEVTIGDELKLGTLAFFASILLVLTLGTGALMTLESHRNMDLTSALSGVLACMCTTGPGLGLFGASENYGELRTASKWILSAAMIIGRLEVFTIAVLLTPRFWRED